MIGISKLSAAPSRAKQLAGLDRDIASTEAMLAKMHAIGQTGFRVTAAERSLAGAKARRAELLRTPPPVPAVPVALTPPAATLPALTLDEMRGHVAQANSRGRRLLASFGHAIDFPDSEDPASITQEAEALLSRSERPSAESAACRFLAGMGHAPLSLSGDSDMEGIGTPAGNDAKAVTDAYRKIKDPHARAKYYAENKERMLPRIKK